MDELKRQAARPAKIVVIGEILVEIVADTIGDGFREPIALTGPYPSGAPAIFADQAARMGQPCAIISAVGTDDFGRVNLDRLQADRVDIRGVALDSDRPTGSAFVRYRADGTRDFVYNIRHAACGRLHLTDPAREILGAADHLHVMGSTLSAPEFVEANLDAARAIKARGGTVSFDPNLRKEVLAAPGVRDAMEKFLALADLFLPSGEEITLLTEARTSDDAAEEILRRGPRAIVHKQGMDGARYYDRDGSRFAPAFPVEEIDPTGAGDCYGAAFTALWLRGAPVEEALTLAAAAGALAVTRRGPMEGASDLATLRAFVAAHRSSVA